MKNSSKNFWTKTKLLINDYKKFWKFSFLFKKKSNEDFQYSASPLQILKLDIHSLSWKCSSLVNIIFKNNTFWKKTTMRFSEPISYISIRISIGSKYQAQYQWSYGCFSRKQHIRYLVWILIQFVKSLQPCLQLSPFINFYFTNGVFTYSTILIQE